MESVTLKSFTGLRQSSTEQTTSMIVSCTVNCKPCGGPIPLWMYHPENWDSPYTLHYTEYDGKTGATGTKKTMECDHVAVGTGTVTHKGDIKKFQLATRNRAKDKILGGKITHVEAHPVPEHPRPCRLSQRVAHVGVAAGYVTKFSGEGIYFAAKNGRMCAETTVEGSQNVKKMIDEGDLRKYVQGA
ncbi:unnamed protein product [Arabidopsis arenosa]|uniref:Uncharacterized protein n=1 Tax=Arabidopsis arenosa TaxID=38785 RepID=A0A8S1ZTX7_ARAAE|nr:unnamed protein product [Arabidopsis arenosa]